MLGRILNPNHRTNGNVACILPTGGRMLNSSLKCNKVELGKGLKRGEPVEAFYLVTTISR